MLLNHLPITFSASQFVGYRVPYEGSDQHKALRAQLFWKPMSNVGLNP